MREMLARIPTMVDHLRGAGSRRLRGARRAMRSADRGALTSGGRIPWSCHKKLLHIRASVVVLASTAVSAIHDNSCLSSRPLLLASLVLVVTGAALSPEPGSGPAAVPTVLADPSMLKDIESYLAYGEPGAWVAGVATNGSWPKARSTSCAASRLRRLLASARGAPAADLFPLSRRAGHGLAGSSAGMPIHEQKLEVRVGHTLVHDCDGTKPGRTPRARRASVPRETSASEPRSHYRDVQFRMRLCFCRRQGPGRSAVCAVRHS